MSMNTHKTTDDRSRISHTLTSSLESSGRSNFDYRKFDNNNSNQL